MDDLVLKVKVVPRSSINKIVGMEGDALKVKVKASPVDGLANKDLVALLSKRLKIAKKSVEIISGHTSRLKLVRFHDIQNLSIIESINTNKE